MCARGDVWNRIIDKAEIRLGIKSSLNGSRVNLNSSTSSFTQQSPPQSVHTKQSFTPSASLQQAPSRSPPPGSRAATKPSCSYTNSDSDLNEPDVCLIRLVLKRLRDKVSTGIIQFGALRQRIRGKVEELTVRGWTHRSRSTKSTTKK